jgi:hypothetical protein
MSRVQESITPAFEFAFECDLGHPNWQALDALPPAPMACGEFGSSYPAGGCTGSSRPFPEAMAVEHDIPRSSGTRVVSFPPYTTVPPLALATSSSRAPMSSGVNALDPNRTHRPTGNTVPPFHIVCARAPSLDGLFSIAVMETLPDLEDAG